MTMPTTVTTTTLEAHAVSQSMLDASRDAFRRYKRTLERLMEHYMLARETLDWLVRDIGAIKFEELCEIEGVNPDVIREEFLKMLTPTEQKILSRKGDYICPLCGTHRKLGT